MRKLALVCIKKGFGDLLNLTIANIYFFRQINYTITNLADHLEEISHDKINRYLKNEKLTPRLLWDNVKDVIEINENASSCF